MDKNPYLFYKDNKNYLINLLNKIIKNFDIIHQL